MVCFSLRHRLRLSSLFYLHVSICISASDLGNKKDWNAFGWHERHKVAVGVAGALDYLHNVSNQPVIHRDVKSSNILLSDDFEPQVASSLPLCVTFTLILPAVVRCF